MKIFCFKPWKTAVLIALAAAFCLVFFLPHRKAPQAEIPSAPEEQSPSLFEPDENAIEKFIAESLPGDLPVSDVDVRITDGNTVELNCTLSPARLIEYCKAQGVKIPKAVELAAGLLPESSDAAFTFTFARDPENGSISFTPQKLSVNGMDFAPELIPEGFTLTMGG